MNTVYRNSLLAAAIAALMSVPGWTVAEQQPSQPLPGSGQSQQPAQQQPMSGSPDATGGPAPAQQMPPATSSPSTQAGSSSGAEMNPPLYAKTPDELDGMDVIGGDGEELGKVDKVVRDRVSNGIYAIVSSGGILGYGAHEVAVPLDDLRLSGDKVQITATQEDLKTQPEYVADEYVELQPPDRPISEFSAFESGSPETGAPATTP